MHHTTYEEAERDRLAAVIEGIIETLERDGVVVTTRGASHTLRKALTTMYQAGRNDQRGDLVAPEHVAQVFGISSARLRQLARQHGLGLRVGNTRVYTSQDIERLSEVRRSGDE